MTVFYLLQVLSAVRRNRKAETAEKAAAVQRKVQRAAAVRVIAAVHLPAILKQKMKIRKKLH